MQHFTPKTLTKKKKIIVAGIKTGGCLAIFGLLGWLWWPLAVWTAFAGGFLWLWAAMHRTAL